MGIWISNTSETYVVVEAEYTDDGDDNGNDDDNDYDDHLDEDNYD